MAHGTFGTALNCIDGRAQKPVADWIKKHAHVDFVDTVTSAGMDKVLCGDTPAVDALREQMMISVDAHGSAIVAIAGHYGCAGNPVSDEEHAANIREAVAKVKAWKGAPERVVGLWVNKDWKIEVIE